MKTQMYIGIDPGIVTGVAIWSTARQEFLLIKGLQLFHVFECLQIHTEKYSCHVRIENPSTWIPFKHSNPDANKAMIQGAGAVKQTYKHICEFLTDKKIEFTSIRIQGTKKKMKADEFKALTKCEFTTNEHGRDAAMMVFGFK